MTKQMVFYLGIALTAAAWISFAEHPTARNLRTAIADTLEFG